MRGWSEKGNMETTARRKLLYIHTYIMHLVIGHC